MRMSEDTKEFDDMSLMELFGFWKTDEFKELEREEWESFDEAVERASRDHFKMMGMPELFEFWMDNKEYADIIDWVTEWCDAVLRAAPISDLVERIDAIEKTLDVFIDHFGHEQIHETLKDKIDNVFGYRRSVF